MANEGVQTVDDGHEVTDSGSVRLHLTEGSSVRDLQPEGEKVVAPSNKAPRNIRRLVLVAFVALAWALSVAIAFVAGRYSIKAGQAAAGSPLMAEPSRQAVPEPGGTCTSACKNGICYFNIFADLNKELAPLPEDQPTTATPGDSEEDDSGEFGEESTHTDEDNENDENAEGEGRRRFAQNGEDPLGKNKGQTTSTTTTTIPASSEQQKEDSTDDWEDWAPALFEDADVFMYPECGEGSGYAIIIVKLEKEKDKEEVKELSEALVTPEQRLAGNYRPYRGGYRGRTYGYYYRGDRGNYYRGSTGRNGRYYYNRGRNYYNRWGGSMGGMGGYWNGGMGGYNGNRGRYGYYRGGMGGGWGGMGGGGWNGGMGGGWGGGMGGGWGGGMGGGGGGGMGSGGGGGGMGGGM